MAAKKSKEKAPTTGIDDLDSAPELTPEQEALNEQAEADKAASDAHEASVAEAKKAVDAKGKGPALYAVNTITGLTKDQPEIKPKQRFYCEDKAERKRLLDTGGARLLAEVLDVNAKKAKIIQPE